jgi:hypothetical protein
MKSDNPNHGFIKSVVLILFGVFMFYMSEIIWSFTNAPMDVFSKVVGNITIAIGVFSLPELKHKNKK